MGLRASLLPLSVLSIAAVGLGLFAGAEAKGKKMPVADMMLMEEPFVEFEGGFGFAFADFRMEGMALGDTQGPGVLPHVGSHGGTLAVDEHGLLTLDRDSGELIRTDGDQRIASLQFHPGAGELVLDGAGTVYVADRTDDRVVVVDAGDDVGNGLKVRTGAKVREPHGLALSPDGKTLYVTSVADHALIALDTATMSERWSLELAQEPRGVAVSADGKQAIVGFLTTGAVASIDLSGSSPNTNYIVLDPAQAAAVDPFNEFGHGEMVPANAMPQQRFDGGKPSVSDTQDIGKSFARNAYTVGFIGDGLAVAPHQLSTPHMASVGFEDTGSYGGGGGFTAPITHRMAMIDGEDAFSPKTAFAQIGVHQPRSLAYDGASDTLYVAGYGNDRVIALAEASRSTIHMAWVAQVGTPAGNSCGADGLAVSGDEVYVHCELSQNVVTLDTSAVAQFGSPRMTHGAALAQTNLSAAEARGAELFRRGGDPRLSTGGVMACASCHAEGRSDGLSWRIEGHNLQTPFLTGRLMGAHPFKWDGKDKDLPTSLTNTIGRLGGSGLTPDQVGDLQAYLEQLPKPMAPSVDDHGALARGKAIFESDEAACSACHDGPRLADGVQHALGTNIGDVDTPSLIGLAHSAPYYHDGSARTLRALLTDKASVHGMGQTNHLSDAQVGDLIVYLESL